jgi:hypothetical protein
MAGGAPHPFIGAEGALGRGGRELIAGSLRLGLKGIKGESDEGGL